MLNRDEYFSDLFYLMM